MLMVECLWLNSGIRRPLATRVAMWLARRCVGHVMLTSTGAAVAEVLRARLVPGSEPSLSGLLAAGLPTSAVPGTLTVTTGSGSLPPDDAFCPQTVLETGALWRRMAPLSSHVFIAPLLVVPLPPEAHIEVGHPSPACRAMSIPISVGRWLVTSLPPFWSRIIAANAECAVCVLLPAVGCILGAEPRRDKQPGLPHPRMAKRLRVVQGTRPQELPWR